MEVLQVLVQHTASQPHVNQVFIQRLSFGLSATDWLMVVAPFALFAKALVIVAVVAFARYRQLGNQKNASTVSANTQGK